MTTQATDAPQIDSRRLTGHVESLDRGISPSGWSGIRVWDEDFIWVFKHRLAKCILGHGAFAFANNMHIDQFEKVMFAMVFFLL